VSKDPIVEVNQSMQFYWVRIMDYYNDNRKNVIERTQNLLQHRWFDIQKDTTQFCSFHAEVERKKESGKSEDDKVTLLPHHTFSFWPGEYIWVLYIALDRFAC
jgi:hypothetical protein